MHLSLSALLLLLPLLSLFFLKPLCVSPSRFSDKAPFIPALPGAQLLALLSIIQPAVGRHQWLRASLLCLWSLMWPASDVHSRKTKACSKACIHSARDMSRGYCHPCAHFMKTPPTMPGPGEMAHNGREPLVVLRNLTLRNKMPLARDLLWALTLHTACSLLTLRASWWLSISL